MVLPYARSPYVSILLYTPIFSRHFTIARGVQGRIDLTMPGGGCSVSVVGIGAVEGTTDEVRDFGSINRILSNN